MMLDIILGIIIIAILASSSYYIYKSYKKGIKCVGCPDSKTCALKQANFKKALDEYKNDQRCHKE